MALADALGNRGASQNGRKLELIATRDEDTTGLIELMERFDPLGMHTIMNRQQIDMGHIKRRKQGHIALPDQLLK
jgi:hypothetical protein